ncbi:MAG: hypothetical protein AB1611_07200 [bacterium]
MPDNQKTAELVQEISSACTEQNTGAEQKGGNGHHIHADDALMDMDFEPDSR